MYCVISRPYRFSRLEVNGEERVTPTRCVVHGRLAHFSKTVTLLHDSFDFLNALHGQYGQVLDKDAFFFVFFELELAVGGGPQQITDFFVIDLDIRASNKEALLYIGLIVNKAIYMLECLWNDALVFLVRQPHHCMRLSTASLPIRKDCTIIATND